MIDIKPIVVKTVNEVIKEINEYDNIKLYWLAPKVGDTLPCIVYNEIGNDDYARLPEIEYANITIQFTNYAVDPKDLFNMANIVDIAMCKQLGFKKSYSGEAMYRDGVYSQVIRFTGIVNHNNMVFKN